MRRTSPARLAVLVAAVGVLLLSGCTESPACGCSVYPSPTSATKSTDGTLRHDLAPLVKRWPALSGATSATWSSGTLGSDRVPGPSTYWIDAVVTLPADLVRTLAARPGLAVATPDVVPALRAVVPSRTLTGASLTSMFALTGWQTTAYVAPDTGQVVLTARGE